ncbi:cupin domain-containing protein [Niallia taxi]|uniref:cupin domain-containing protein n=1 Tax=Niallia taxi TaxID=2499688 RepID=UPI002040084D|nr:cupin domain-containing protein [Niallia taxi]MCM3216673.1 cupin domain-containing protein [Niallia taxi]
MLKIKELLKVTPINGRKYCEFLRENSMSLGIYTLGEKDLDEQLPHSEDEVYIILEGEALINIDGENKAVKEGDVIFVPAFTPHFFTRINGIFKTLVIFSPAEYTNQK